jgi:transcriptional regulator with XRE-family HTH domain
MSRFAHSHELDVLTALLRKERERRGLRQIDVANRLGQPQSFVSKYESGERILDVIELRHVCIALGVSLAEFVQKFEESI